MRILAVYFFDGEGVLLLHFAVIWGANGAVVLELGNWIIIMVLHGVVVYLSLWLFVVVWMVFGHLGKIRTLVFLVEAFWSRFVASWGSRLGVSVLITQQWLNLNHWWWSVGIALMRTAPHRSLKRLRSRRWWHWTHRCLSRLSRCRDILVALILLTPIGGQPLALLCRLDTCIDSWPLLYSVLRQLLMTRLSVCWLISSDPVLSTNFFKSITPRVFTHVIQHLPRILQISFLCRCLLFLKVFFILWTWVLVSNVFITFPHLLFGHL